MHDAAGEIEHLENCPTWFVKDFNPEGSGNLNMVKGFFKEPPHDEFSLFQILFYGLCETQSR